MTPSQQDAWNEFRDSCIALRTAEAAFKDAQARYVRATSALSTMALEAPQMDPTLRDVLTGPPVPHGFEAP